MQQAQQNDDVAIATSKYERKPVDGVEQRAVAYRP